MQAIRQRAAEVLYQVRGLSRRQQHDLDPGQYSYRWWDPPGRFEDARDWALRTLPSAIMPALTADVEETLSACGIRDKGNARSIVLDAVLAAAAAPYVIPGDKTGDEHLPVLRYRWEQVRRA